MVELRVHSRKCVLVIDFQPTIATPRNPGASSSEGRTCEGVERDVPRGTSAMTTRIGVFGFTSRQSHAATTLSLGSGLALAQSTTLILDLSGEGGLSESLGLPFSDSGALTAVLTGESPPEDLGLLVRTVDVGLDVVPGCRALEATASLNHESFARALDGVEELYATTLVHCPGRARSLVAAALATTSRSVVHLGLAQDAASVSDRRRLWLEGHREARNRRVHFMVEGHGYPEDWIDGGGERWHLIPEIDETKAAARRVFESEWVTQPEAWVFGNLARELLQGE